MDLAALFHRFGPPLSRILIIPPRSLIPQGKKAAGSEVLRTPIALASPWLFGYLRKG
jgi:hypothetical protein